MELKSMVVVQLALDALLAGLVLWCIWRDGRSRKGEASEAAVQSDFEAEIDRWQKVGPKVLRLVNARLKELRSLAEELDRSEIRAAETLQRMERGSLGGTAKAEVYQRASGWIREGVALEEIARRTGFGLDELRLIQSLSETSGRVG
jgi:hypothetical protein